MYELRSMLQTSMVVTGSGYTPVKGSNVFLYSWNDGNNRKWNFTQDSGGRWRLQNAANGLYMTLASNTPANGVNIRQWTSSTNAIQYWNIIETGETANFEGYTCPVVKLGSYATSDGNTWMMDVDRAMTTNNTNIQIWPRKTNGVENQEFLLVPSALANNSYPTPAGLGWTRNLNNNPYGTQAGQDVTDMKLGWRMPSTWTPTSTRGYERRVRSRLMDATTSTWGAWSTWTQWADVDPYVRDVYCYDMNLLDASFNIASHKAKEFQAEVRCKNGAVHGQTVSRVVRNIVDPTATLTSGGVSDDGLVVNVTSDYAPATYTITSMVLDGKELVSQPTAVQMLGTQGTITVPWDSLDGIPEDGAVASVRYTRGTDLFANINGGGTRSATLEITYGEEPSTSPTLTETDGRTLKVTHPSGVTGVWVSNGTGVYGGVGENEVIYPFSSSFDVLVAIGDGTMYRTTMVAQEGTPVHAFNWDGGSFLLECDTDPLVTDRTITADYEAMSLNSRPWQSVHFTDTLASEFSVVGLLYEGVTSSHVSDLMDMLRQQHVTYRAPSGEVAEVAVVSASYQTHREFTKVEVNLIQESR